jgi:hypothetical protein
LKQIAKDGSISYSNIVFIKGVKLNTLVVGNVYPNPTKDVVNVTIASPNNKNATVTVTNLLGKTVVSIASVLNQGDNTLQIKLGKLSAGQYTITVVDADGKKSNIVSLIKE